jgi:hypothetical protein
MAAKRRGAEATTRPDPSHAQRPTHFNPGERSTPDAKRTRVSETESCNPRFEFECPCGGTLKVERGHSRLWVWVCSKEGGGLDLVQRVAEAYDLDWRKLIDDPSLLGQPNAVRRRREAEPVDQEYLRRCAVRLRRRLARDEYLVGTRQLAWRVLIRAEVGWDHQRKVYTFPFYAGDVLETYKWRKPGVSKPGAEKHMFAPAGTWAGTSFYLSHWEPADDWWLLTGGEIDALRARAAGLPAVSMPLGVTTPIRDEWADALRGRRVVVCFDVGEEKFAEARADDLGLTGVEVDVLDLRALGLDKPKGDLSDYLNAGGDVDALCRRARRA